MRLGFKELHLILSLDDEFWDETSFLAWGVKLSLL